MIVNACPNRLKSFAIQLAVNALAGSIPAAFLVLVGIRNVDVARSLVVGIVFANAIGFPASFVIPRLYPRVASRGPAWEWSIITLVLVGLAILGCLVGTAVIAALGIFPWSQYWLSARSDFTICIFITLAFGLVMTVFSRMQRRLHQQELDRQRAINLATEAQLASLESRIHPHFLFNTLNSISALIPVDPERAERLMERMAALLRFSLDAHARGLVPLDQEMKIVRDYLEIEQARLGSRLRYQVDTPGEAGDLRLPPLAVQTLIENSIKYAVAPDRMGGEIRVLAHETEGRLQIEVSDTGPGFLLESAPPGHGLDNLRNRLAMLFGETADLRVTRQEGWTTVRLMFPVVAPAANQV
ncbi:MAG TPA: histidine kinase [Bryobacteraceae bacterium]|jgi:two-component system sensor histidine kinase AlgZ|nr:histidine kinase [Bryobacteraceae bacterium]